nr:hypothetical protein [uncultured bacterium]
MDACMVPKTLCLESQTNTCGKCSFKIAAICCIRNLPIFSRGKRKGKEVEKILLILMDKEGRPCISGRDLFASLHVLDMNYETWFQKMKEYDFRVHEHYTPVIREMANPAKGTIETSIDHLFIIPMAVEIMMLQPTESSRSIRLDLVETSIQWNDPASIKKRLRELLGPSAREQEDANESDPFKAIPQQKKNVTYADVVERQKEPLTISVIANDYGLSGPKLNELLECLDVQYKAYGSWYLHPDYEGKGYVVKEAHGYNDRTGIHADAYRMKWTPKGRMMIYELLQKIGIKPRIEVISHV